MNPKQRLCCIATLAVAIGKGAQVAQQYDAVATSSYKLSDGSELRHVATCTYDQNSVNCLNPDGSPNAAVGERIQNYYMSDNGNGISFGLKKKNRLIVFKRSPVQNGNNVSIVSPAGTYVQSGQLNGGGEDGYLGWAFAREPQDATSVSLVVIPGSIPVPEMAPIEFKEGAKFKVGSTSITLGGTQPAERPRALPTPPSPNIYGWNGSMVEPNRATLGPGKLWYYFLSLDPPAPNDSITYTLFDKSGKLIRYVDRNGNIVSELTYVKAYPPPVNQIQPYFYSGNGLPSDLMKRKYIQAQVTQTYGGGSVSANLSNVNPESVGFIKATALHQTRILFKDIPLDPKQ